MLSELEDLLEHAQRDVVLLLADWRAEDTNGIGGGGGGGGDAGAAPVAMPTTKLPLAESLPDGVRVVREAGRGRLKVE